MPGYDATWLSRRDGLWRIVTRGQTVSASIVVNAAGAWADEVARRADLPPLGIEARRRTVAVVSAPLGIRLDGPMTADAARNFYVRPAPSIDGIELFMSPCDEAPLLPGDAQPQAADLDLVRARLSEVCRTEAGIAYAPVRRAWAGLRSFAPDELPVVGFDPLGEAFFWVAGQGGHRLQAAPGIAELTVTLVLGEAIGGRLLDEGVQVGPLSVRRSAHSSARASRVST